MKISNVLILLALVFFAFKAPGCYSHAAATAKYAGKIKEELNKEIADMACVPAWSRFPFRTKDQPGERCLACDKLVDAGLVTKEVVEDLFTGAATETRYEFTDVGRDTYEPGTEDGPNGKEPPRFCFGRVHVKEITRTIGPLVTRTERMLGVYYIAEIDNPNPYLFDPRATLLRIPLPVRGPGTSAFYPERDVTVVFEQNSPDAFHLDSELHINAR